MATRPFREVIKACRRLGFDAIRLLRQLQTYDSTHIECFGGDETLAWLASQCKITDNAYHEFCDFWLKKDPSSIICVLNAALDIKEQELADTIRMAINDILNNKQCFDEDIEAIELFEAKWKAFMPSCPQIPPSLKKPKINVTEHWPKASSKSIFISYSWACRPDDVHALARRLRTDFNVWLDKDNIKGGEINEAMATGIESSDVVLICFSEAYKKSQNCYKELCHAERCRKPIALVMLHPGIEERGPCWIILQFRQYVTYYNAESLEHTFQELVKVIRHHTMRDEIPFFGKPASPERFFARKASMCNEIRSALENVQLNCGVLVVTGDAGVGKTTLVSNFIRNLSNLNCIIWKSCSEAASENHDFVKCILADVSIALRRKNILNLEEIRDESVLFVFDDVVTSTVLEMILDKIMKRQHPVILIFRSDHVAYCRTKLSPEITVTEHVEIPPFSQDEMRNFLLDTWQLRGKVPKTTIEEMIADFNGNPGLATIWARDSANFQPCQNWSQTLPDNQQQAEMKFDFVYRPIFWDLLFLHFRVVGAPRFEKYYGRTEDEESIKRMLSQVTKNPAMGIACLLGGGGNGKSTIMSNIIHAKKNHRYFNDELGVKVIIWLNCYQWNKPMREDDKLFFINKLLDLGRSCLLDEGDIKAAKEWRCLSNMITFFLQRYSQRLLFILDDCFNEQILTTFRSETTESPCCVISRYQDVLGTEVDFYGPVTIYGLSEAAILDMFKTTHKLKDELATDKLMYLAKCCCGSPLVASLIAGQLRGSSNKEKVFKRIIEEGFSKLALKSLSHSQKDDEKTARDLFQQTVDRMGDEEQERYFSFLLYDPVEPVPLSGLARFWNTSDQDALETLNFYVTFGIASKTSYRKRWEDAERVAYQIHQILHEALLEKAKARFKADTLWQVRLSILIERCPIHVKHANSGSKLVHTMNSVFLAREDDFLRNSVVKLSAGDFDSLDKESPKKISEMHCIRSRHDWYPLLLHFVIETASRDSELINIVLSAFDIDVQFKGKTFHAHCVTNFGHYTPMSIAAYKGHLKTVEYLASTIPELVKTKNNNGDTPLSLAAYNGHLEIVRYLQEKWPESIKLQNESSQTPLAMAASNGHLEVVELLTKVWPEAVEIQNENFNTPLALAARNGHIGVVDFLIKRWPQAVEILDYNCNSPLSLAAYNGNLKTVQCLVKFWPGAVELQNNDGNTPLSLAATTGNIEVVKYLAELCPSTLLMQNKNGNTPLSMAAYNGHIDVVKFVAGLKPEAAMIRNLENDLPLTRAAKNSQTAVVKYLLNLTERMDCTVSS